MNTLSRQRIMNSALCACQMNSWLQRRNGNITLKVKIGTGSKIDFPTEKGLLSESESVPDLQMDRSLSVCIVSLYEQCLNVSKTMIHLLNSVHKRAWLSFLTGPSSSSGFTSYTWDSHTHSWHSVEIFSSLVLPRKTRTRALKFPVLGLFSTLKKEKKTELISSNVMPITELTFTYFLIFF